MAAAAERKDSTLDSHQLEANSGKSAASPAPPWLTLSGIPIKLERSNRGCPDPRECAAIPFCSSLLGGRPIGRTPDSGSGYPGSSPGLPANLFNKLWGTLSQIWEHLGRLSLLKRETRFVRAFRARLATGFNLPLTRFQL